LVTAVEVGCMFVTSGDHIELYEQYMLRYLTKMKELYKEANVVPYHHISLHLGDFLCSFGPVHAWRTFAFERYNHLLQQENTNGKFGEVHCGHLHRWVPWPLCFAGEMELTFMTHTCRSANLRSLIVEPHVRETVAELAVAYETMAGVERRGTLLRDMLSWGNKKVEAKTSSHAQPTKLDDSTYNLLLTLLNLDQPELFSDWRQPMRPGQKPLPQNAVQCSGISKNGIFYQPNSLSPSNSNILFRPPGSSADPAAGKITQIFTHTLRQPDGMGVEETFIAVSRLDELSDEDAAFDNYRRYPLAGGRLTYDRYNPGCDLIRPSNIVCHFAKTVMRISNIACVHVLPLDRVSVSQIDTGLSNILYS
jgi:hypothetical protein